MVTILVPAPSKSAFNKNRPVSDLLQHQLRHFQHIEASLPTELHSNMTARELSTENGAAKYIAHLTEALKSLHGAPAPAPVAIRPAPRPVRQGRKIAIAASAAEPVATASTPPSPPKRKTSAKPASGNGPVPIARKPRKSIDPGTGGREEP